MKDFFDLIAIPKGMIPGAPIQSSGGDWFTVCALIAGLQFNVERLIETTPRLTLDDLQDARDSLDKAIAAHIGGRPSPRSAAVKAAIRRGNDVRPVKRKKEST